MEWLTIILAGLLSILTPTGLIVDSVIEHSLRQQVKHVDTLEVRVDNVPSYQALSGKLDRIRIASRGIEPIESVRIDTLEVETDAIDLDINALQQNKGKFREALRQPLQGGVRIVLTEADLNRALASDALKKQLQQRLDRLLPAQAPKFKLITAQVSFADRDRLQAKIQLQQGEGNATDNLDLAVSAGIKLTSGRTLELFDPQATLNGKKLSTRILKGFTDRINERLDLRSLESGGIWLRLLQLKIGEGNLEVAGFVRVSPVPAPLPATVPKSEPSP